MDEPWIAHCACHGGTGEPGEPKIVYLGYTLMSREEYEKKMSNEAKSCYIDYGTVPWYNPSNPYYEQPQNPSNPNVVPGFLKQYEYNPPYISVTHSSLDRESKWKRVDTLTHVSYSIDLASVKSDSLNVYVESGVLVATATRVDNGNAVYESLELPLAEIDINDVSSVFETCVLKVTFLKRPNKRINVAVNNK